MRTERPNERVAVWSSILGLILGLSLVRGPAEAATGDDPYQINAAQRQIAELSSITATVGATGTVSYHFAGYHPAIVGVVFTGEGSWDPKTKRAQEQLSFPKGKIQSSTTCDLDPWSESGPCAPGSVSGTNGAPMDLALLPWGLPVGARLLSPQAHLKAKAAYAEGLRNRPVPTPTHTPTPHSHLTLQKPGAGAAHSIVLPTSPPSNVGKFSGGGTGHVAAAVPTQAPAGPQYAAHYLPQLAPPAMKANQPAALQARVENTSSRAWNLGWPASQAKVSVACRWFQGPTPVGSPARAPIGGTVLPGATTTPLAVSIHAPVQPGAYTLKWDLVEDGPGGEVWFSSKGVPTFDQAVTVTK